MTDIILTPNTPPLQSYYLQILIVIQIIQFQS